MGDMQAARDAVRQHVKVGLDLLSDDDEENDWQGYWKLAIALTPIHDVYALAAWSLLGPIEKTKEPEKVEDVTATEEVRAGEKNEDEETTASTEKPSIDGEGTDLKGESATAPVSTTNEDGVNQTEISQGSTTETNIKSPEDSRSGYLPYSCDGNCGKSWSYADDWYSCKDCLDVQFNAPCLEKLKSGTLKKKICHPSHTFLYVPKWDDEAHKQIPKGSVKVGEEIVTIKEWLDRIRNEWHFPISAE